MSLDYRSVLDVYPEDPSFTCIGTTRQNLRCRNSFIRNDYRREASDILDELPSTQQYELLPKLRQLAWLTLCPRWHQSRLPQVEPVAAKWLAKIQNLAGWRPQQSLLTPPPTPPPRSAGIFQSMSYHPAPPPFSRPEMGSRDIFYQQWSSPPPPPPNIYQTISYYSPPPSPTRNVSTNVFHQHSYPYSPYSPPPNISIHQSISCYSTPPPPTQTIPRDAVHQQLYSPPPPQPPAPIFSQSTTYNSPPTQTLSRDAVHQQSYSPPPPQPPAPIVYQSITYNSPTPQIMSRDVVHQQPHPLAPPPPPQPRVVPITNMAPNYNQQNLSSQPQSFQQTQGYTSQTGRNINIIFDIAVDSNGVFQDPPRRTQVHEVTTESPTQGGNLPESTIPSPPASPSSTSSSNASTASRSSSSTSSSSSRNRRALEAVTAQLTALQAQMTVLAEQQQAFHAQAQAMPAQASRTAGRSTSTGSSIPSIATTVNATPRLRSLTPSPRPSRRSVSSRNRQGSEDPNTSDDSPSSSSTNSSSNHRPGRPRARIHTPSSSGNSSPVIVSPPRSPSPHPASVARSEAPGPSSSTSIVSHSIHRRPINEDTTCYVCDDPIVSEADAAWCRAACGQNICLGCFVAWVAEQRAVEQVVVCGFCRAPWRF